MIGAASIVLFHVIGYLAMGLSVCRYKILDCRYITFKFQASMGSILAISPPNVSSLPNPDSVMECYIKTSAKYAICVPSYLEVSKTVIFSEKC
jgi:hypothetical protein